MNTRVLRRFIIIGAIATLAMFSFWVFLPWFRPPPGDFETRQGDIHLRSSEWADAVDDFDAALDAEPSHRGAWMGRAIALLELGQSREAEAEYTRLIQHLTRHLEEDDTTGRGVLAAAYANRGILRDRERRYEEALADYVASLNVDEGAVSGPDIFHKILHDARPSTVRDRALYINEQLALPEEERVLSIPEIDARQRMHKP